MATPPKRCWLIENRPCDKFCAAFAPDDSWDCVLLQAAEQIARPRPAEHVEVRYPPSAPPPEVKL